MANIVLNYQYYLTNVNWTNEYDNVLYLPSKAAKVSHFDLDNVFDDPNYNLFNFNISNLYKTTVVIDCSDYITAMQSNYLIVKNKSKNEYYFYFITNAKQTNFNRIELNIELDIYQQYAHTVTFVDAPINRCKYPLNKKRIYPQTGYCFNNDDTLNYNAEDFNVPQKFDSVSTARTDLTKEGYFADICYAWMYVFVDPSYDFEFKDWSDDSAINGKINGYMTAPDKQHGIYNNIGVIAFPIYSGSKTITLELTDNGDTYSFALTDAYIALEQLKAGHSGADAAHIYSVKISRRLPFSKTFIDTATATVSATGIKYSASGALTAHELYFDTYSGYSQSSALRIGFYYGLRIVCDANQEYIYQYNVKSDGTKIEADAKYNPASKLYTAQYLKSYIDFGDGNKLEFDLQKVNYDSATITLAYKEAIVPDITRYSVSFKSNWYNKNDNSNTKYTNETFTSDTSLIFTIDQWSEFLANNKNFYAQGNFNTMMKLNKGIVSGAVAAGQMNYLKAGTSLANMYTDTVQFVKNREFQVDNLQSAVDRVINQNGNACFDLLLHGLQPIYTRYTTGSDDATRVVKYLKMYGVNTEGLIDNPLSYINGIDFNYCYIQADVNEIKSGTLPLECEKALLRIYNKGVRIWFDAAHMYDYSY